MGRRARQAGPAGIDDVCHRIEEWRRTRVKRSPMPKELWAAAVGVAADEGVYATARRLRVNYESLKARMDRGPAPGAAVVSGTAAPSFIELKPMTPAGLGATAPVIELSNAAGEKLTFRFESGAVVDVMSLADAFWSRSR